MLPKEVASAFNIEPMNDTSMKELIALNARGKWVCSKAWTGSASNAKTDESASVSSIIAEYGGSSPSSSSFWLLKVISGWITCARDHQRRHLHHSAKVFFIQLFFPKYGIWFFLVAIRGWGWALSYRSMLFGGYHSMLFRDLLIFSDFLRSLMSIGNSYSNSYIPCL